MAPSTSRQGRHAAPAARLLGAFTRMHAALVTETEINRVVDFWRSQATPDYDQSFLIAPPGRKARSRNAQPSTRSMAKRTRSK